MAAHSNRDSRLVFALLATMLCLGGCSHGTAQHPAFPSTEVGILTLQPQSVALQSELPGRTAAFLVSDVRPQVSGLIKKRLFEEGADVRASQVLYQIDPSSYQAAVDQAKADLANTQAMVASSRLKDERYRELIEIQGVSKQDADDAHASYLQAVANVALKKAALQSAQINLAYTQVRAPISGRIGKSSVTAGALVTANQETALATIRALDPIYVDLTQSSTQLLQLRKLLGTQGMESGSRRVRLKLEDGTDYSETGTLKFQEVAVDQATGSVTLRAQFPNPRGVLLPGMYVRAVLDDAVNTAALLAPQQSISRDATGGAIAMVVGKNNQVEQRSVITGRAIGNNWLVVSGLSSGDRLIVEGLSKVHPGDSVRPLEVANGATGQSDASTLARAAGSR